jgi:hypothetical protein
MMLSLLSNLPDKRYITASRYTCQEKYNGWQDYFQRKELLAVLRLTVLFCAAGRKI